jgi:hypothetical protein
MRYLLVILLFVIGCNKPNTNYLYDAYSHQYDENYIIKSNVELSKGQIFNYEGDPVTILKEYK